MVRGMTHADSRRRREAVIADIRDHVLFASEIAAEHGISEPYVFNIARRAGLPMRDARRTGNHPATLVFFDVVRDGYANHVPPKVIAAKTGKAVGHVKCIACKLGLTKGHRRDPARFRRGFDIPDHLFSQYRDLRRLGLTTEEAGIELGLIERNRRAA